MLSALLLCAGQAPAETPRSADFDGDGIVDFPDFLAFVEKFGSRQGDEKYEAKYDLNGDGEIGMSDFLIFKNASQVRSGDPATKVVAQAQISGLAFRVEGNNIAVLWASAGSGITDYRIQWNKADEEWNTWRDNGGTAFPTGTSYTIENLSPGRYKIRVRARINRVGGPWSSEVVATIHDEQDDPLIAALGTVMTDSLALIALYNSTTGASWTNNTNWGSSEPLGDWFGVYTNSDGRVTTVNLGRSNQANNTGNNLSGMIPSELGDLDKLRSLYLHNNQLTGSIPTQLGSLDSLEQLNLGGNQLSGMIPSELGDLDKLRSLLLNDNQLTGSIPTQLGSLDSLQTLILYENQLSGMIPSELGDLDKLGSLSLYENSLTGSIPSELGDLDSLRILSLYGNQLSGSIPASLGNLTNLWRLTLRINSLTGSIPTELGSLDKLEQLYLEGNQLGGSIPSQLGSLTSLKQLTLQSNQLTGSIPTSSWAISPTWRSCPCGATS